MAQGAHTRIHELGLLGLHVGVDGVEQNLDAVGGQCGLLVVLVVAGEVGEDAGGQSEHCELIA